MKAYPLVFLEWHDASDEKETWLKTAEISDEPYIVHSIGFLVRETAKYLTLAGDQAPSDDDTDITWGRVTKVPVNMIQQRSTLVKGE